MNKSAKEFNNPMTIPNPSADQNPDVSKCVPINPSANNIITAVITNENNPKVKIVNGKENNFRIGLTTEFKSPNTIAKIIAYKNPLIVMLSNKKSPIKRMMAEIKSLMIIFFMAV